MGFFSSIGKVFKKVAAPVAGVLGGVLGGPAGAVAGATIADAVWNGGSSGSDNSDWYKSAYGDQMGFAREQFDFNKQYIQNQLQWRVEDAKKAGLHPMAVLGLNGASFSPVSSPSIPSLPESTYDPSELGQSVAYAATKAKTNKQQEQAFAMAQATAGVQMEGLELDNEFKRLQIMELVSRLTQTGPAAPVVNSPSPLNEPVDPFSKPRPDGPFTDKPIVRDGWLLDEKGRKISVIPSEAMKGRTEDVLGVEWFPFISSAYRDARGRMLGHEINGHWWHGLDKGYLPYPPKSSPRSSRAKVSDYYSRSYRY